MKINVNVNGYLTIEVDDNDIIEKLKNNNYIIGLIDQKILSFPDFEEITNFKIVNNELEYNFEE